MSAVRVEIDAGLAGETLDTLRAAAELVEGLDGGEVDAEEVAVALRTAIDHAETLAGVLADLI